MILTLVMFSNTHNVLIVCSTDVTVVVVVGLLVVVVARVECGQVMLSRRGGGAGSLRGEWGNTWLNIQVWLT